MDAVGARPSIVALSSVAEQPEDTAKTVYTIASAVSTVKYSICSFHKCPYIDTPPSDNQASASNAHFADDCAPPKTKNPTEPPIVPPMNSSQGQYRPHEPGDRSDLLGGEGLVHVIYY